MGNTAPVFNGTTLHFRGIRIIEASLKKLAAIGGLNRATSVVLTGFSHGGTMALLHADRIGASLRRMNSADGLQHFGVVPADAAHPLYRSLWGTKFPSLSKGWYAAALQANAALSNATAAVSDGCKAKHPATEQWRCLFANEAMAFVQSPLFLVQQIPAVWDLQCALDGLPSGNILQVGCSTHNESMLTLTKCVQYPDRCDPAVVAKFMVPLQRQQLREFAESAIATKPTTGQFFHHCYLGAYFEEAFGTTNESKVPRAFDSVWNQISIDGLTMREAIDTWWLSATSTNGTRSLRISARGEKKPLSLLHADTPWDPTRKAPEYRAPWTGKKDPPVPWWTSRFMSNPSCQGYPWY